MSSSQVSVCLSCQHGISWERLLPHLAAVVVEAAELASGLLCLQAHVRADHGVCPRCRQPSARVHSTYRRRLGDVPAGGRRVVILLAVRRFFCTGPGCPARTFAEQAEGLTSRYARRTPPLAGALTAIAVALAGRAGARLAALLHLTVSRSSLLRLVMALPDPAPGPVRALAVDDFAFRRGSRYGTVLVNAGTGQVVDLLPDREAQTLEKWLKAHPGTGVICRDRAGAYADGARKGAPDADQVADRWHLWHNLCEHVEKAAAAHRDCLKDPQPDGLDPAQAAAAAAAEQRAAGSAQARQVRERYEQVHALHARGTTIKQIMQATGLARITVSRYLRTDSLQELLTVITDGPPTPLDQYKPYLRQRWNAGCRNAQQLHTEIRDRGYRGSYGRVAAYLRPFRRTAAPPAAPAPPRARDIAAWILTSPDHLTQDQQTSLAQATSRCPHLNALAAHVTAFAKILTGRHGDRLDNWITTVKADDDQPHLHSFARGLQRDHAAVLNGLTLPWNSGIAEGTINKIKMLKRQMYGRASLPLLRKRVLLAP